MKQFLLENAKAIAATLTALGTWGTTALAVSEDGSASIEGAEWFGLCGVAVVGITTWLVTNAPSAHDLESLEAWKNSP